MLRRAGIRHELVGSQNIDEASAIAVGANEILERQCRLAEEFARTLVVQDQQLALYRSDGRLRHIAVMDREFAGMIRDVRQHGTEVLEVEDRQTLLIGHAETNVEHAFLNVIEIHEPRQQ